MGVVQKVHNDMTVASCTVLIYTLPEIEQTLVSVISLVITFSPLQSLNNLTDSTLSEILPQINIILDKTAKCPIFINTNEETML